MAGGQRLDSDDPATRSMLLDLFTDISILEHLVRERFNPAAGELNAQQFGVINYLVRQKKSNEKLATLAWCFQVETPAMAATVDTLAKLKYVEVDWVDGDRCVFLTAAGTAQHETFLETVAPDVTELVSEFDPEALRITTETLKDLRRTFDNLPDR
jgi:DNA-binding MarR family transcriptional regulator